MPWCALIEEHLNIVSRLLNQVKAFLKKIKKRAYSLVFLGAIRLIRFGFITVANIPANIPK